MLSDLQLWYLTTNWNYYSKKYKLIDKIVIEDKCTGAYCDIGIIDNNLIIAFKGTELKFNDIITDALFYKKVIPYENTNSKIKVHSGFLCQYKSIRNKILKYVGLVKFNKVYVIGHSLGGALSTLCSIDLQYNNLVNLKDINVIIYGSPRVGNKAFKLSFNKRVRSCRNYQVVNDLVTKLPLGIMSYKHIGKIKKLGISKWYNPISIKAHLSYFKYL